MNPVSSKDTGFFYRYKFLPYHTIADVNFLDSRKTRNRRHMSTPPVTNGPIKAATVAPPSPTIVSHAGIGNGDSTISSTAEESTLLPDKTISVEKITGFGSYQETVSLSTALEEKWITPKQAVEKGHCTPAYLTARGYDNVTFSYTWFGITSVYEGKLKKALRNGYITIEEAIGQRFITKEQAIEGGFLKAEK
jgi:hypothetical protein